MVIRQRGKSNTIFLIPTRELLTDQILSDTRLSMIPTFLTQKITVRMQMNFHRQPSQKRALRGAT